jgi:hypothetical protein
MMTRKMRKRNQMKRNHEIKQRKRRKRRVKKDDHDGVIFF